MTERLFSWTYGRTTGSAVIWMVLRRRISSRPRVECSWPLKFERSREKRQSPRSCGTLRDDRRSVLPLGEPRPQRGTLVDVPQFRLLGSGHKKLLGSGHKKKQPDGTFELLPPQSNETNEPCGR